MHLDIIVIVILVVLAAVFKGERDTIAFKPGKAWFITVWWTSMRLSWKSQFQKFFLAPFMNGWHFTEYMQILFYHLAIGYLWAQLYHDIWALLYVPVVLTIIHWIWFHFSFEK